MLLEPCEDDDDLIGTAPGADASVLDCPSPDEPVGLVPPGFPMTKEPGGDVEEAGPSPILDDDEGGDIIPLMPEPGEPTPGVPLLPPGVETPPTKGDGEAWGIASGVGISLPYSPFCFPAFERAQSPESVALYIARERERVHQLYVVS